MANQKQTPTQLQVSKLLLVTGLILVVLSILISNQGIGLAGWFICMLAWLSGNRLTCPGCGKNQRSVATDSKYCGQCGTPYFPAETESPPSN